jgi:DNA-binding NarL/FixJ family response regulator
MTHRVVVVEDHPIIREAYAELLSTLPDFHLCGDAPSISRGFTTIMRCCPDLALVDLHLTDGFGLDLVRTVRGAGYEGGILVVSTSPARHFGDHALRCGANGYVSKHAFPNCGVDAMREVVRGGTYLPPISSMSPESS